MQRLSLDLAGVLGAKELSRHEFIGLFGLLLDYLGSGFWGLGRLGFKGLGFLITWVQGLGALGWGITRWVPSVYTSPQPNRVKHPKP